MWTRLLQDAGHEVKLVDVYGASVLEELRGCHGFMWRHGHYANVRQIARRLLPVLENCLGLVVYPDQNTCWHYDDKIAQAYLFESVGLPAPKTWVFFDRGAALDWANSAQYPVVVKLWSGAGSTNVRMVRGLSEARELIEIMFRRGVHGLDDLAAHSVRARRSLRKAAKKLTGRIHPSDLREWANAWEMHRNYVLFQEFLSGNDYDTRVTVIGDRAFAFRRFNREDDFRASGSGKIDYDLSGIDPKFVQLAFHVADKLKTQSCAIDGLWRGDEPVVGEISYTYVSSAVYNCPGHWDSALNWHEGQMWPEQAQLEDFLERLSRRFGE